MKKGLFLPPVILGPYYLYYNPLGLNKMNFWNCSTKTKHIAYKTLVSPKIEYASSIWDPHKKINIHEDDLVKVQRRADRFVKYYYNRTIVCQTC